jgi:hypothetical protein
MYFSRLQLYNFKLRIYKHAHKDCWAPSPETSKTADMEKDDIRITQIDYEIEVVGEDRLQSNFHDH